MRIEHCYLGTTQYNDVRRYDAMRNCLTCDKQELSYRKQIARQLRTQYVEGILGIIP